MVIFNMFIGILFVLIEVVVLQIEMFIVLDFMVVEGSDEFGVFDFISFIGDSVLMFVFGFIGLQVFFEYVVFVVNMNNWGCQGEFIEELQCFCQDIFGFEVMIELILSGFGGGIFIEVCIVGCDMVCVGVIVEQVKGGVCGISGMFNVCDDWGVCFKKIFIWVNEVNVQCVGVMYQDIVVLLQGIFSGIEVMIYCEDEEQILVMLCLRQVFDSVEFGFLNVFLQLSGCLVFVDQVIDVEFVWQLVKILCCDWLCMVLVFVDLQLGLIVIEVNVQLMFWFEEQS